MSGANPSAPDNIICAECAKKHSIIRSVVIQCFCCSAELIQSKTEQVNKMGQAKNRKAEIAVLKQNPKKAALMTFGAFYKDDCDDGVAVVLTRDNFPMIDKFVDGWEKGVAEEVNDQSITNQDVLDQLKEAIEEFNVWSWGTKTRPAVPTKTTKITDEEWVRLATVICTDIMLLTKRGVIKNDKFNGLLYLHAQNA